MILERLNYPCDKLKGIGSKSLKILNKIGINSVANLLEYFPRTFSDRTKTLSLADAINYPQATVKVVITDYRLVGKRYNPFLKILIYDGQSYGALICFNRNYLKNVLTIGTYFYITGKFTLSYNEIHSTNFEYEEATDEYRGKILPIYRLTDGLTQNILRVSIGDALKKYRLDIEDELPPYIIEKRGLLRKREALANIHFPVDFQTYNNAKMTFIFEEFFYQKLFLLKRKEKLAKVNKNRKKIDFTLKQDVLSKLDFKLMDYQEKALSEIENDIFCGTVFSRLLQGDVGSGKTIVALLAMLSVIESGEQTALLVPTEVLANQHYKTIKKLTSHLSLDIAILTASLSKKERTNILNGLKSGEIKMVIGTHALISDDVIYKNLGFVVIDEQQRFGVEQRYQLLKKGDAVDVLLMTATPIPRSLAMSLYGDLSLTTMEGTIKGRIPVKSWLIDDNEKRIANMHNWIKNEVGIDGRAIFVYPLIEESDKSDYKDLNTNYEKLKSIYGEDKVAFIHSKVSAKEKDQIIQNFRDGIYNILVATTVVEVGLDVPDATVMVVENAENYGLSALHQLRGRVGRNNKQGYMIMVTKLEQLTEDGKKRLEIMTKENNGFKIAEEDLLIRGPGDFIGSRQSGLPNFKFGDIREDFDILKMAFNDAQLLYNDDSELQKIEHLNIKASFLSRLDNYQSNYKDATI